ncbi:biotin--[acetyl-CoA-carboxylase] ligase [Owenweeksia hongkongensis]|uniref:biotin--[acetyl-CoA-carboxylase] ligase n=1 Tax=Owenweeksia hongkongensis TaxID=253245 RepID=UPI003A91DAAE
MASTSHLNTLFIGHHRLHFESLDSTNNYLKELIGKKDVQEGLVVTADYQTSGRGQIGNTWASEPGVNLLMSVFFKPHYLNASHSFYFNMSVCLAVADALNFFHAGFQVKWPNDILFDGKKICGILIENSLMGKNIQHSVVGIGINVNQNIFDKNTNKATSLRQILGHEVEMRYFTNKVLEMLEKRYHQLQRDRYGLLQDYFAFLYGYKQTVAAFIEGKKVMATIIDVLADGHLKAEINGKTELFQFKEISFEL